MQLFKRISSTVLASVDKVIGEVENHDAVVDSMLKEMKGARAQCQVRLNRVANDGEKMQNDFAKLVDQEKQWTNRAEKLSQEEGQVSEQKALACLERRRKTREQISKLEQRLAEHTQLKTQLQTQLKSIDDRFVEINNKKHVLQSQQSVAEVNRVVAAVTGSGVSDIDATLDRWEISIAKMDANTDLGVGISEANVDDLAAEFEKSESQQQLMEELSALRKGKPDSETPD